MSETPDQDSVWVLRVKEGAYRVYCGGFSSLKQKRRGGHRAHAMGRRPEQSRLAALRQEEIEFVHNEARSWLTRAEERFDPIQMSLIDTWAATGAGAFTLSENGLYTVEGWQVFLDHLEPNRVAEWANYHGIPILTTNFDNNLCKSGNFELFWTIPGKKGRSYTYPWSSYYSMSEVSDPCRGFGIWHINGMEKYPASLRLGLTHYMRAVRKAMELLHGNNRFSMMNSRNSVVRTTWLNIFFNKPLLFFGIALDENEVFLRWLLIQRAKYFKEQPEKRQPAWYLYTKGGGNNNTGKLFFLEEVSVEPIKVESFDDIYGSPGWQLSPTTVIEHSIA